MSAALWTFFWLKTRSSYPLHPVTDLFDWQNTSSHSICGNCWDHYCRVVDWGMLSLTWYPVITEALVSKLLPATTTLWKSQVCIGYKSKAPSEDLWFFSESVARQVPKVRTTKSQQHYIAGNDGTGNHRSIEKPPQNWSEAKQQPNWWILSSSWLKRRLVNALLVLEVVSSRVIHEVTRLGGKNGQFRHNMPSNT